MDPTEPDEPAALPTPSRTVRRFDPVRIGISAVVAVAIGLIIWGFGSAATGDQCLQGRVGIERIAPSCGDKVLRQSEISVKLTAGYTGRLSIDGQLLPIKELEAGDTGAGAGNVAWPDAIFDRGQSLVSFRPKKGATIDQLAPGHHFAKIEYWKLTDDPGTAKLFSWSFDVS
jgi:hypothetical protein